MLEPTPHQNAIDDKEELTTGGPDAPPTSDDGDGQDKLTYSAENLSGIRQFFFVGTVCTAMFTNQVGTGNTLGIVGIIGESFNLQSEGELSWLVAGYALTVGTFVLLGGRLGDMYGYKRLFMIGMGWYALWSLVAGLSVYSNHVLFIFARVFQGLGPAMTLPNGLALLGTAYRPGPRKNMAFAWFGGSAPFGSIGGFTMGGLFALAWWPWVYWSQAIALVCLGLLASWAIPDQPLAEEVQVSTGVDKVKNLDLPGGTLGVSALVLINFAWNQAVVVGWQQAYVYVTLIIGMILLGAFIFYEARISTNPLLPFAAFNGDIAFVFACTAAGWGCFGIWVFYAAQLVLNFRGVTPILLAAWYSPVVASGFISALTVGRALGKVSPAWVMLVGQVAYFVGSILMVTFPLNTTYWGHFFFSVLIICVGMDTSFPAATIIFSNAVEPRYQGMAASVVLTIVNYSISLGLGFAGTVETQTNDGGAKVEQGYRNALWMAVGLAGLGLVLSLIYVVKDERKKRRMKKGDP
nr:efflux pump terg [Quercus suber]